MGGWLAGWMLAAGWRMANGWLASGWQLAGGWLALGGRRLVGWLDAGWLESFKNVSQFFFHSVQDIFFMRF